jgi:hypothetical protein
VSSSFSRAAKRASSSESGILGDVRGGLDWIGLWFWGWVVFVFWGAIGTTVLFGFAFEPNLPM